MSAVARLRYGLLGTGYWASETHAAALSQADAEFVGVWGRSRTKADALAARYGVGAFDSVEALLNAVDAVAIAVPPDVQADLAVTAAAAGKHLLLDKPLALRAAQADRVVAAVEESGVASVVFFTTRFCPESSDWQQRVCAIDGWRGGRACWLASAFHEGSPYADSAWRRERGALWDVGPHALAMVLPIFGEVRRVAAVRGPGDAVHAVLEHASASTTLSLGLTMPRAAARTSVEVYGESGWSAMPESRFASVEACSEAIRQLGETVASGAKTHPCDARFARDVTALLARIEAALPTADTAEG